MSACCRTCHVILARAPQQTPECGPQHRDDPGPACDTTGSADESAPLDEDEIISIPGSTRRTDTLKQRWLR